MICYHYKLLADLRKELEGYHIAQGRLFGYVACPHYFFETISWPGILLLSQHLFAFLALIVIIAYLTQRSIKTRRWYLEKFSEYPKTANELFHFCISMCNSRYEERVLLLF